MSLSQRAAGRSVGMSAAQFGRIERAEIEDLTLDQASRACAAVGLHLLTRAVPGADPAVDAGQLALLERFQRQLPSAAPMPREVPIRIPGDRRAWDAMLRVAGVEIGIEAETRIRDVQAVDRKCALKARDGGVRIVILVVADTAVNRRMLGLHREALRASFPLDTRQVMGALRAGRVPSASGIVIV